MRFLAILSFIFLSVTSQAQISNITVPESGRSNYDSSTVTIYGGIAGATTKAVSATCPAAITCSGTNTCDNCCNDDLACNPNRIHTSTRLTINFDTTITGANPQFIYDTNKEVDRVSFSNSGGNASITMEWDDICEAMESSNCSTDATETFTLTVGEETASVKIEVLGGTANNAADCANTNPTAGYCNWRVVRGNEKAALFDGEAFGDTDDLEAILVMYGDPFTSIGPFSLNSSNNQLLEWESNNNEVVNSFVSNLTNGNYYDFKTAMVDKAGNFYNFFTAVDFNTGTNCSDAAGAENNFNTGCPHSTKPEEVEGLLEDDLNCFITTAAYGSSFSSKVETFRQFRNTFMAKNKVGMFLIHKYYNVGPKLARGLYGNDNLKGLVRAMLYPVWAFAALSLKLGLAASLFLLLSLFSLLVLLFNKRKSFN